MKVRDPLGTRALFEPAPGDDADKLIRPTEQAGRSGRRALFTAGERRAGTVVLHCSHCEARTRVGYVEFLLRHLPFWVWIPGRRHSRFMRCPACEQRSWIGVNWLA